MSYALVIDVGTQSMRGLIFDSRGNLLAKEKAAYPPYIVRQNGFVEQSVDMFWRVLQQITNSLAAKYPQLMCNLLGMSVDTFRDTFVLLDKDMNPLRDCILWTDHRHVDTSEKLPIKQRLLFKLVGMDRVIDASRQMVKTSWVKQNEPDVWAKVHKVVFISAFLNYKLTGCLTDSYASCLGHLPFDNKHKRWMKKGDLLFPVFDLPTEYMSGLCAPGDVIGCISAQTSALTGLPEGLKVFASGSDKGCETLGGGVVQPNMAGLSFGTSCTVQFSTKKYFEPEPFMPGYAAVLKDYYNPELQIYRGFWTISWFKQNFAKDLEPIAASSGKSVEQLLDEEAEHIPAGCDGLVLLPFWQAGLTSPEAKGAIVGFSDFHTRAHIYRAIIEGVGFALREGLERMERRGGRHIDCLVAAGGGSQSDTACQIAADLFNRPLKRVQTYETSGLGAATVVFMANGVFADEHEAVREMVHYQDKIFVPNPQNAQVYDNIYKNVWSKLYGKLRGTYKAMDKLK